jgi:hypothetical protein
MFNRSPTVALAGNGWGLTKFCLLPNYKNMKKPKGKILFKPLLGAVASTTVPTKLKTFFVFIFFSGDFKPFTF